MRLLMKMLYAARIARSDLQRAINTLGSCIHKWSDDCQEDLKRLMDFVFTSLGDRQYAWVGNWVHDIAPHLYADADFASDHRHTKSHNGVQLCLKGTMTFMPLSGVSKKQDAVSHSTPEAEIVAAAFAVRREALPSSILWELLLVDPAASVPRADKAENGYVWTTFHEDNQTMIRVVETGRNPTMRHLGRTHYIQVSWLNERFQAKDFETCL